MRIISLALFFLLVFSIACSGNSLDQKYFMAEGLFVNDELKDALQQYQALLSFTDKSFKYHEKSMFRIITILKKDSSLGSPDLLKNYCKAYLRNYPSGNYAQYCRDASAPARPEVKPVRNVNAPMKAIKEYNIKRNTTPPVKKQVTPVRTFGESIQDKFKKGVWSVYNVKIIGMEFDKLTLAVKDVSNVGSKVKCTLLARWENAFKKRDIVMTVLFKSIDSYMFKDVVIKTSGSRQQSISGDDIGQIGLWSIKRFENEGYRLKDRYVKTVKGIKIDCYEYVKGEITVVYSSMIPVLGALLMKGRESFTAADLNWQLIDFGYSGGDSLF